MKPNMGMIDRGLRLLATFVIFALYYAGTISGTLGIVLMIICGIFFVTSLMGVCPLYSIFRVSRKKKKQ